MKNSKKAIHTKAAIGIGAVLLLAGILWFSSRTEGRTAEVLQDGKLLYTFSLEEVPDQTIRVEYGDRYNIVQIDEGRIRVLEADCPDQICVRMGWLHSAAPVVCLPNRLVIQFADKDTEPDAVAD